MDTTTILGHGRYSIPTRYRLQQPSRTPEAPRGIVVALHGMGQSAELFHEHVAPLAEHHALLIPDGPLPFEVNEEKGRRIGHAWYVFDGNQDDFLGWAERTGDHLEKLLDEVCAAHPIDRGRVALLGYSQGGYLAGILTVRHPERYRALVAIAARIKSELLPDEMDTSGFPRVMCLHGERDRLVSTEAARESAEALAARGIPLDFRTYDCGHRPTAEQIADAGKMLSEAL